MSMLVGPEDSLQAVSFARKHLWHYHNSDNFSAIKCPNAVSYICTDSFEAPRVGPSPSCLRSDYAASYIVISPFFNARPCNWLPILRF